MLKPEDCFRVIKKSEFIQDYFDSQERDSIQVQKYHGFTVAPLPLEILLQEPLLKKLHEKFPIKIAGYIKIDPYRCYRWHADTNRKVGINMLLNSDIHCYTLFGQQMPNWTDEIYETVELKYEPNTLYSFNTQIEHTVINFEETRWLFSVEFDSDVTYEDINAELG